MHETKVVLADDHPLFVEALEVTLESAEISVLGTAADGGAALELVAEQRPDALVLDLRMPGMDGLACLERVVTEHPEVKVVVLSSVEDPDVIARTLAAGADCFVSKSVEPDDIVHALRVVTDVAGVHFRGEHLPVPPPPTRAGDQSHGLTRRELEILRLVSDGSSNAELAQQLWVTEQTVKFHLSNVYRKLDVPNRTAAAARASELGLLDGERAPATMAPLLAVNGAH